ncbi:Transposase IS4-like domain-containing protein [Candidatus Electrothrix laxa]
MRSIKAPAVHIITKAKKNYVGYFQADPSCYTGMGRPSQYGEHIHLAEVFDHLYLFQKVSVRIYGHMEEIYIYHLDLLWKSTKGSLRFVFAKTSRGPIVLMCSNLDQDPIAAIELYCLRTRIETMFDMLKNVLHIFQCHFWSKKMPKHSRKPKSNKTQQTPQVENAKTIQACWDATERFVNLGAISLGLLQLIALKFPKEIWSRFEGFLRTRSRYIPSERTVKMVIANLLVQDFLKVAPTATMREIRAKIIKGRFKKKIIQTEDHVCQRAA